MIELELLQPREAKRKGIINQGKIAVADAGDAQGGCEAECGRWLQARQHVTSIQVELLKAIEGRGPEPAVELGIELTAEADATGLVEEDSGQDQSARRGFWRRW